MRKLLNILHKPYPYYIPSASIRLLFLFSLIIPVFLIIFEPFGLDDWQCEFLTALLVGLSVPIFIGLAVNFYGVSKTWPAFFNEDTWSIGKELIWSIWNMIIILIFVEIY